MNEHPDDTGKPADGAPPGDEAGTEARPVEGDGAPPTDDLPADGRRPGLPWEDPRSGRTFGSAMDTVRLVLFQPGEAFARMRVDGALSDPLLFLILFGTVGAFFGMLWQTAFRSTFARLAGADLGEVATLNSFGVVLVLMAPLVALLGAAIVTLLIHGGLMLFGGAPRPLEVTLRTMAYANGATYLFAAIPVCGGIVSFFWWVVVAAIGVRQAQEVPGGRAVAAVLLPVMLACLCCGIVWATVVATVVSLPALS